MLASALRSSVRPVLVALGFLTCLPTGGGTVEPRELARSLAWFPAVGALLGLLLLCAAWLLAGRVTPAIAAVVLLALLALLSGGLHLDGLADTFDGLAGGRRDRQRMLGIMRDGRIGACGAAALCVHLLAKWLALAELLGRGPLWPLLVAPAVARFCVVPLILLFPYVRDLGLGRPFSEHAGVRELVIGGVLTGCVLAAVGPSSLLPALLAMSAALTVGVWVSRRLGGLTGDVYGAAVELSELALLLGGTLRLASSAS